MDWLQLIGAGAGLVGAITGIVALRNSLAQGRAPRPMSEAERKAEQRRAELRAIVDEETTKP